MSGCQYRACPLTGQMLGVFGCIYRPTTMPVSVVAQIRPLFDRGQPRIAVRFPTIPQEEREKLTNQTFGSRVNIAPGRRILML
jgi:hypothetical protein